MIPIYDSMERVGQKCLANNMRVNGRMCCEEWRSNDIPTMK